MEEGTGTVAHRPQYSAFISYSHADAAAVSKLHARLETYRLPKGLGRIDPLNAGKRGLGKVFRDREDLSAAASLSDAVIEALSRSRVLVVICSPEAKASRWVAQEIAYFREHCPGRPILAAIVRGEPQDVFPAALTEGGTEPLAADLRKAGDGWKLGFLKIVAGIADVPLDALIQRESQRQMRRVMAVTGVVAAIALAMGAMTMIALQARAEAELARAAAQARADETAALNSYFINDFRNILLERSQLEVALEFYPKVYDYCRSAPQAKSLGDKSQLACLQHMRILGTDLVSAGRMDEAKAFFDLANDLSASQLQQAPQDPAAAFEHYLSQGRLGFYFQSEGQYRKAADFFRSALDLLNRADADQLGQEEWLRHKSYAQASLANALDKISGAQETALVAATKAVRLNVELLAAAQDKSAAKSDLAFHLQILAQAQLANGDAKAAFRSSGLCVQIVDGLIARDQDNVFLREQKMHAYVRHARIARAAGEQADAAQAVAVAQRLQRTLKAADPNNKDYDFDISGESER